MNSHSIQFNHDALVGKNGAGILAQRSARGSAKLTKVTITDSATGDIVIEPGSAFIINQ